jgi:signal transduction histidine kinase
MANNIMIGIFSFAAVISAVVMFLTLTRLKSAKREYFVLFALCVFIYEIGSILDMTAGSTGAGITATKIMYLGSAFVGPVFLMFVQKYCEVSLPRVVNALVMLTAGIIVMLVWTSDYHTLYYSTMVYNNTAPIHHLAVTGGPLYMFGMLHPVFCVIASTAILIWKLRSAPPHKKKRLIIFIVCTMIPTLSHVLYIFNLNIEGANYAPIFLTVTMAGFYVGLIRYDLLDNEEYVKAKEKSYITVNILLLLMLVGVLFYNYVTQIRVFWQSTVEQIAINTMRHGEEINTWFAQKMVIVDMIYADLHYFDLTEMDELGSYFSNITATNPSIAAAYFGAEDKTIVYSDGQTAGAEFDPTIRVWYMQSRENPGKTIASDPYVDILTGKLVVTLCRTIQLNNGLEGVIGIDLFLDYITDFVNSVRPYYTGTSFLLSAHGDIVTHAEASFLPEKTDNRSGAVEYTRYSETKTSSIRGVHTAHSNVSIEHIVSLGIEKYKAKTKISEVGWYYGCEIPVSDFSGSLLRIALPLIIITIIGLFISALSIVINQIYINVLKRSRQGFKEMVANIAHDLKTPLAVMSLNLETLSNLAATRGNAEYRRHVRTAYQKNLDLQRLTQNLLEVSRIESGKISYSVKWESLQQIFVQLRDRYDTYLEDCGIELDIALGDDVEIGVDPAKVWSVFDNIIYNAARHTNAGGRVTISASIETAAAVVTLTDTGSGISAEHLPKIFERFYKGSQARGTKEGDSGLGLYIVKSIMEGCGAAAVLRRRVRLGGGLRLY